MKETLKNELLQYIDKLDEYQLRMLLAFISKLFD